MAPPRSCLGLLARNSMLQPRQSFDCLADMNRRHQASELSSLREWLDFQICILFWYRSAFRYNNQTLDLCGLG